MVLSYPLGRHIAAPRRKKARAPKKPAVFFMATVWLYTDDTGTAKEQLLLRVPNESSAEDTVALAWARAARPPPSRGASDYRLMQCHADGEVNDRRPFLHHTRELRPQAEFPYMFACCLDPFRFKLEGCVWREERARHELAAQEAAYAWNGQYCALLGALAGAWALLSRREAAERQRLLAAGGRRRSEVLGDSLSLEEVAGRAATARAFEAGLARLAALRRAAEEEAAARAARASEERGERRRVEAEAAAAAQREAEAAAFACGARRALRTLAEGFNEGVRRRRMLYNESRIASNISGATASLSTPYAFHTLRVALHEAGDGDGAGGAEETEVDDGVAAAAFDLTQPDTVSGDLFTSSWPLPGGELVPEGSLPAATPRVLTVRDLARVGTAAESFGALLRTKRSASHLAARQRTLVEQRPHLMPGYQPSLAFSTW